MSVDPVIQNSKFKFKMQTRHAHATFEFCILNLALPHLYGSIRSSFGASASDTCSVPRMWRFDLVVLLVRIWRLNAFARMILPVPVFLKRFAAPRCVFNLGIVIPLSPVLP